MEQRFYSDEEAESILRVASQRTLGGMDRDTLLRTAAELGISPEDVAEAERTVATQQRETALQADFKKKMKDEFLEHLTTFIFVNAFLVFLNFHTKSGFPWSLVVIGAWSLGLGFHVTNLLNTRSETYQKEFEKWKKKRLKKERREAKAALE